MKGENHCIINGKIRILQFIASTNQPMISLLDLHLKPISTHHFPSPSPSPTHKKDTQNQYIYYFFKPGLWAQPTLKLPKMAYSKFVFTKKKTKCLFLVHRF